MVGTLLLALISAITPADPRIVYVGRFDTHDPAGPSCQWSASEVRLRVKGDKLTVDLKEKGHDLWQVEVDGKPSMALALQDGPKVYTVLLGGAAEHEVRLVKRTEAFVGTTEFLGFNAGSGEFLAAKPKARHLEVVGDSISCGYGNEGPNQNEHFKPETENAYMSYASIAAREVAADVTLLAWSGRKMWPDNTMPEIYDRVLPTESGPLYDFKGPAPDAVVINLATNDFGRGNPDEAKWTDAYEAFIRRIWSHYPKAQVYAATGSMMSDGYPPGNKALSTLQGYLTRMIERMHDSRLHLIEFDVQKQEDGIGSDWHPSVRTHEKMAAKLAAALKADLGW